MTQYSHVHETTKTHSASKLNDNSMEQAGSQASLNFETTLWVKLEGIERK